LCFPGRPPSGQSDGAPHPFSPDFPMLGFRAAGATCVLPDIEREDDMADSVYKVIELIGTSKDSWEKAAAVAVGRASKSLRELRVAEVCSSICSWTPRARLKPTGPSSTSRSNSKVREAIEGA